MNRKKPFITCAFMIAASWEGGGRDVLSDKHLKQGGGTKIFKASFVLLESRAMEFWQTAQEKGGF